jgi:signal transduction histidine kinase
MQSTTDRSRFGIVPVDLQVAISVADGLRKHGPEDGADGAVGPVAGELRLDAAAALTGLPDRRTGARPDEHASEATTHLPDPGGRTGSEFRRLCDGLLRRLESERARVSTALGDEIVSVMTMARYLIEDAAQRLARGEVDEASEALQNSSARIRDATSQVLALCSELRPRVLDDLGLLPALSTHFRDFGQDNRAIFVSPRIGVSEGDLPDGLKLTIFRIVQAALSNVAHHSRASAVRVFLSLFDDELRLGIEDNGVGFDVERWRHRRHNHDGCGLGMIQRWAETTGGRCHVEAVPSHGVKIQVVWPMRAAIEAASLQEAATDVPRASSTPI